MIVFSAVRVYALLNGEMIIACIVFLCGLAPLANNLVRRISYLSDDAMAHSHKQYGYATSVIVQTGEICAEISTSSRRSDLGYVSKPSGI